MRLEKVAGSGGLAPCVIGAVGPYARLFGSISGPLEGQNTSDELMATTYRAERESLVFTSMERISNYMTVAIQESTKNKIGKD